MTTVTAAPPARPAVAPARRGNLALLAHQIRYEQITFWRNPQSAFFTFVFPVAVISIFGALFGGAQGDSYYYGATALQYYVPTIAALSLISSCYSQLAVVLALRRQYGLLKRARATPLPAWTYFLGLLAHCAMISIVDVALITGIGAVYGMPAPTHWAALLVTMVAGAACMCAVGIAVGSLIRNADAAPAVVQFILFPLILISGTFFPIHGGVLSDIAGALPVRALNQALLGPFALHTGFAWHDLAVLVIWCVFGSVVGVRFFRWEPHP